MSESESAEELVRQYDDLERKWFGGSGGKRPPVDPPTTPDDNDPMDARIASLEAILPHLATKADISDVRGDIQRGIGETHKWMIGTVIGLFIGFGGLFLAMSNALKPPAPTQPAPIIINVPAPAPAPLAAPPGK